MRYGARDIQPHPMWLFEENYMMLRKLLSGLEPGAWLLSSAIEDDKIDVLIDACGPYTVSVTLRVPLGADDRLLRPLLLKVHVYSDARLAEVRGYQECHHIPPAYAAAAARGFVRDERRQVNHFLYEVLRYCLDRGYAVSCLADAV